MNVPRARGSRALGIGSACLGLVVGVVVPIQPVLTAVAVVALFLAFLGAVYPSLLVVGMWCGILFDRLGVTGMDLGGLPVTASKLTVLASVVLWGVHVAVTDAHPFRWHPVLGAMVGMLTAMGICIAAADSMAEGGFDFAGLAMMTVLVGLIYAVLAEAPLRPLYHSLGFGVALALLASLRGGAGAVSAEGRATGTMGDPNEWATTVLLLVPFVLGGLADDPEPVAQPLRMALVLLAPAAVLASGSRAALAVGTLTGSMCLYLLRHRRAELVTCAAAAGLAAPFLVDVGAALARFRLLFDDVHGGSAGVDPSYAERSELFRQGVQLFRDHWFIGAGPGMFATATGFVSREGMLRPAHDTYLQIASEQGVVGLVPTVIFLGTVAATLHRGLREAGGTEHRSRVLGIAFGLGALALMAATLGLLTFAMAWLVLGFGLAVVRQAREARVGAR